MVKAAIIIKFGLIHIDTKKVQMDCEAGWELCGFVK